MVRLIIQLIFRIMASKKSKGTSNNNKNRKGSTLPIYILVIVLVAVLILYYAKTYHLKQNSVQAENQVIESLEQVLFGASSAAAQSPVEVTKKSSPLLRSEPIPVSVVPSMDTTAPQSHSLTTPVSSVEVSTVVHTSSKRSFDTNSITRNISIDLGAMSWKQFIKSNAVKTSKKHGFIPGTEGLLVCSNETVYLLSKPVLTEAEIKWCKKALDPAHGGVIVSNTSLNFITFVVNLFVY